MCLDINTYWDSNESVAVVRGSQDTRPHLLLCDGGRAVVESVEIEVIDIFYFHEGVVDFGLFGSSTDPSHEGVVDSGLF